MTQSDFRPEPIPDGIEQVNGRPYMADAKGALVPLDLIKPQHLLEDQVVRKIMGFAIALSDQVARFKAHVFEDLGDFDALLAQEYGLTRGGPKGNRTYSSHDGLYQVEIRVADLIDFGPELQVAKQLTDECLNEWAADSRPEIRAVVTRAFNTDKEGRINRAEIFMMLRLEIEDGRWKQAMRAVRDAIRVVGSRTYVRIRMRAHHGAPLQTVTIDLAAA